MQIGNKKMHGRIIGQDEISNNMTRRNIVIHYYTQEGFIKKLTVQKHWHENLLFLFPSVFPFVSLISPCLALYGILPHLGLNCFP